MENSCCETLSASPICPAFGCSTAPQRWAASADSTRCSCSWPHTKPASLLRLLLLPQHSPRMWGSSHHSSRRSVSSLGPIPTHHHFVTPVRASPQMKPKQLHCVRVFQGVANRLVTATIPYLLTRFVIASLSCVSRSLGHSFAFSSMSCPGDILSGLRLSESTV